jgi:hypothetical protein
MRFTTWRAVSARRSPAAILQSFHSFFLQHGMIPVGVPPSPVMEVRPTTDCSSRPSTHFSFIFITFIESQGASHGQLNQPSPQFQPDRPQSVKVYGRMPFNTF